MKKLILTLIIMAVCFTACAKEDKTPVEIVLSDSGITVDGSNISADTSQPVYAANDIIFYLENQGEDYGEGEKREEHSQLEADRHTVVHITQPGDYTIRGKISAGQIAVDLGKDTKSNPDSKVNITLNNADITCSVAPAIVCYSAYECGSAESKNATKDVDTTKAGFNINIADGSVNNINGSHVAKIFDENGDKLHKYDRSIESLVSLNIDGNDGVLNLTADNEGIETKMHMTINGGVININSMDDSLNAGEDGISVITINGGKILCNANNGAEGDGIDSNGWLVINGGSISAFASDHSMDSGLDSDNGIYINGGTVFATGGMYDNISKDSMQNVMVFNFNRRVKEEEYLLLKTSDGTQTGFKAMADSRVTVYSSPQIKEGDYTLYKADDITGENTNGIISQPRDITGRIQQAHTGASDSMANRPQPPQNQNGNIPQMPDFKDERPGFGSERPDGMPQKPDGEGHPDLTKDFKPEDMPIPLENDKFFRDRPDMPDSFDRENRQGADNSQDLNNIFTVSKGINSYRKVQSYTE